MDSFKTELVTAALTAAVEAMRNHERVAHLHVTSVDDVRVRVMVRFKDPVTGASMGPREFMLRITEIW